MEATTILTRGACCIDATCETESSLGQVYIANATCENSKATATALAIQRPHCAAMRLK